MKLVVDSEWLDWIIELIDDGPAQPLKDAIENGRVRPLTPEMERAGEMVECKHDLVDRADVMIATVSKMNVSYSFPKFSMSTAGLASMARGEMKQLIIDMRDFIERSR